MDLQDVVNANQHRFSETEREILAFMLENEEFVAESTINSLAHKTYTSTSYNYPPDEEAELLRICRVEVLH